MNSEREPMGWRRVPGWMKLLLIVSLSANVAVAGLVGGTAVRHWQSGMHGGRWPNEPGLDRQQSRILRMVPEARREEARSILLAGEDEYRAAREALQKAQQALVDAMRQDPLNGDRLEAALAERQAVSSRLWGIGYHQMAEITQRLDAAERAEMAQKLEDRTRRWLERQAGKER